jgi:hypothetical protein
MMLFVSDSKSPRLTVTLCRVCPFGSLTCTTHIHPSVCGVVMMLISAMPLTRTGRVSRRPAGSAGCPQTTVGRLV